MVGRVSIKRPSKQRETHEASDFQVAIAGVTYTFVFDNAAGTLGGLASDSMVEFYNSLIHITGVSGRRGQQVAIFGVEEEDQPHQAGQQALVEMMRIALGKRLDPLRRRAMQASE